MVEAREPPHQMVFPTDFCRETSHTASTRLVTMSGADRRCALASISNKKMREPKLPLFNQSCFQYAMFCLEPPADVGGFLQSGRIVVERDRDHGIRIKAPLLFLRHLRSHE